MLGAITRTAKQIMMAPILSLDSKRSLTLADKPNFLAMKTSKTGKIATKVASWAKARNDRRRFAFKVVSLLISRLF